MTSLLSPNELGKAIGVSESSLKRWADKGRLRVARTAGGHRRIHLSEALRFIRETGFAIVRPEILGLAELDRHDGSEPALQALHAALETGDEARASGIIMQGYVEGRSLAELIDELLAPVLRHIGTLWRHGDERGILVEHRASEISTQILHRIRALHPSEPGAATAVGGTVDEDFHALPSLMAATVLATRGWSAINLSGATPAAVLAQAAREHDAELVWLALTQYSDPEEAGARVVEARDALRAAGVEATLIVGGPATGELVAAPPRGVQVAVSMNALDAVARDLRARAGTPAASV